MSLDGRTGTADGGETGAGPSREELAVQVELLEEEVDRLREEYGRMRRTRYRRTAAGLLAVGVVAIVGGLLFPGARTTMFAFGATGAFAAVLTYYLTPEQFVSASVSERIYAVLADNEAAIADDLGLSTERVYVPTEEAGERTVRLFVPQFGEFSLPETLDAPLVVTDDERERGLSLRPTGEPLFEEFERALAGTLGDTPEQLASQLTDAIVEQFELASGATTDVGADGEVVVVDVTGSAYGRVDRFDHPVASLLGVGIAGGLDVPVTVSVDADADRADYTVEVRPLREPAGSESGGAGEEPEAS